MEKIVMSKADFKREHKRLLKVLTSGKGLKKEAARQTKEMKKYF